MEDKVIYEDNGYVMSVEALYCVGGYITYDIAISCCGFSGECNFCIAENALAKYIKKINYMLDALKGEVEISDSESDAYLKAYFEDSMNFYMKGQIGGSYEDNTLKFNMKADQTLLQGLKDKLLDY